MKLTKVHLQDMQVSDLSALQGMPLDVIALWETQVKDLKPLAGMKLTIFDSRRSPFSDISAPQGYASKTCGA